MGRILLISNADLLEKYAEFSASYNAQDRDKIWIDLSQRVRDFFQNRILSRDGKVISDEDCDAIIAILDRSGKGNTKSSEAIARAMIPQGAWRRMVNELHANHQLGSLLHELLLEESPEKKVTLIDQLYEANEGHKNYLSGRSGNAISTFLAAFDPLKNLSAVSLNHRRSIADFFHLPVSFDWDEGSIGTKIVRSNLEILEGVRRLGLQGSAREFSEFFYSTPEFKSLWTGAHTVKRAEKDVSVVVPDAPDSEDDGDVVPSDDSVRESMQIQGLIAKIGTLMGFKIWLPKSDRGRVLKVWEPKPGELLDSLPLGYDPTTTKTIEQIDVLWMNKRSIVRAFEVEHTTSVYSGLLRMADLVALQPNINVNLHIVAPSEKRDKVLSEIQRPVFSLLEGRALSEMCTYLSYESIRDISNLKHLSHLSDKVIEDYSEQAD